MLVNKKANFNYEIIEKEIAGISLVGSEVKPLRFGHASINESYIYIKDNYVVIKNMYIKNNYTNHYMHEEYRERNLLLTKQQINKWKDKIAKNGYTIVPLKVFSDDKNRFKIEIALAKGKKLYDKRESIKIKDLDRDTKRLLKK